MHVVSRRVKIMKINYRLFEESFRKKIISNMEFSCKVYKFDNEWLHSDALFFKQRSYW